jgi:rare lipoprotein A
MIQRTLSCGRFPLIAVILLGGALTLFSPEPLSTGGDDGAFVSAAEAREGKVQVGRASWYGARFHGKKTASGKRFDQHAFTAAHRSLEMGSLVRVTNLENGRAVVLQIIDRGPRRRSRIIDVSKAAASHLGFLKKGIARVRLEVLREGQS